MTDSPAGTVRWYVSHLDGGVMHLYEPHRTKIGDAYHWEALCGLHGVAEDGRCQTCLELLTDACAERSDA